MSLILFRKDVFLRAFDFRATLRGCTVLGLSYLRLAVAKLGFKTLAVSARNGENACEMVRESEGPYESRDVG